MQEGACDLPHKHADDDGLSRRRFASLGPTSGRVACNGAEDEACGLSHDYTRGPESPRRRQRKTRGGDTSENA